MNQVLRHVSHDLHVGEKEIVSAHARLSGNPSGYDADVRVGGVSVVVGAEDPGIVSDYRAPPREDPALSLGVALLLCQVLRYRRTLSQRAFAPWWRLRSQRLLLLSSFASVSFLGLNVPLPARFQLGVLHGSQNVISELLPCSAVVSTGYHQPSLIQAAYVHGLVESLGQISSSDVL